MLQTVGLGLTAASFWDLGGCSSSDDGATTAGTGTGGTGGAAGNGGAGATVDAGDIVDGATEADAGGWATGGTGSIGGPYPDPFSTGLGTACKLTCAATLGPCYAKTLQRKDISESQPGLPVRLAFLIVDESCKPIEGADVDIWHTSPHGLYSGDDSVTMCTLDDPAALAARWFRGVQTTDAKGRVDFDTCFPGWYKGRTIHIHFTVRVNGTEYVTSQFLFDDALNNDILTTQPEYNTHGTRDTTNANDSVVAAGSVAEYTFQSARMPDGVLLAWKAIVLRSSTGAPLCTVPGGGGGPGGGRDGGFPPMDGAFPPFDSGSGGGLPPDGGPIPGSSN